MSEVIIKDRLREALSVRGMSAEDLARKSGINKGSISKYLSGKVIPKQSAIGRLADALGVSPAWILGYNVNMDRFIPDEDDGLDLKRLTPDNLLLLKTYYKALIDSQGRTSDAK